MTDSRNDSHSTDLLDPFSALVAAGALSDPEDSSDASVLAARAAIRRAATTETLQTRVARRRRLRTRALVGTAALVAASVVIGGLTLRPDAHNPAGPGSAAAAVLERAAEAAQAEPDLFVTPGEFLKITLVQQSWNSHLDADRKVARGQDGEWAVNQERWTRTIWIPSDVDADWTFREHSEVLRNNSSDPRYRSLPDPDSNRTWTAPSWADDDGGAQIETYDPDWYATLSRDPATLLGQIKGGSTAEGSGTAYDFQEIYSEVLRGLAPADVRAALFQGLAARDGMVVEKGVTTLDGREGSALGAADSTWRMVFDDATGAYIGERATDPEFPPVAGLDADRTTWLTSVTREVVDSAPPAD